MCQTIAVEVTDISHVFQSVTNHAAHLADIATSVTCDNDASKGRRDAIDGVDVVKRNIAHLFQLHLSDPEQALPTFVF